MPLYSQLTEPTIAENIELNGSCHSTPFFAFFIIISNGLCVCVCVSSTNVPPMKFHRPSITSNIKWLLPNSYCFSRASSPVLLTTAKLKRFKHKNNTQTHISLTIRHIKALMPVCSSSQSDALFRSVQYF